MIAAIPAWTEAAMNLALLGLGFGVAIGKTAIDARWQERQWRNRKEQK